MITIIHGNTKRVVTRGAYESFYRPLGYTIADSVSNKSQRQVEINEKPILKQNPKKNVIDKDIKKSQKVDNIKKR